MIVAMGLSVTPALAQTAPAGAPSLGVLLSRGLIVEEVSSKNGFATARVRFENRTGKRLQGTVVRCFAIGKGGTEIGTEERPVRKDATLDPGFVGNLEVPVPLNGKELRLFSCKARTAVLD